METERKHYVTAGVHMVRLIEGRQLDAVGYGNTEDEAQGRAQKMLDKMHELREAKRKWSNQ